MAFLPSLPRWRRNNQVTSMETPTTPTTATHLFQTRIADHLPSLPPSPNSPTLTLPFLRKLLDTLHLSSVDLLVLLHPHGPNLTPLSDLLLHSLDSLNSFSASLDSLLFSLRHASTATSSLLSFPPQPLRALSSLSKLLPLHASAVPGSPPAPPRSPEPTAALAMCALLSLSSSCLAAAFHGADGVAPIRTPAWALDILDRLVEEWHLIRRLGSVGMLGELREVERLGRELKNSIEIGAIADAIAMAAELAEVCRGVEEEVGLMRRQVREVFQRMVRCRVGVMEVVSRGVEGLAGTS